MASNIEDHGFAFGVVVGLLWLAEKTWKWVVPKDTQIQKIVTPLDVKERVESLTVTVEALLLQERIFEQEEKSTHTAIQSEMRGMANKIEADLQVIREKMAEILFLVGNRK